MEKKQKKNAERVTIGFVNFNNFKMVNECVESTISQLGGPYRMIFVDNASTDGSRELIERKYSQDLEIIKLDENGGPNPARNLILKDAKTEYVLFLDADVVLENDVVIKLIQALDSEQRAAVAAPKIMDYDEHSRVQFNGTLIHYIGAAIHLRNNDAHTNVVTSLGGACLLVRKKVADKVNGWDEDLFFGWTDGDFVYRTVLAGYQALSVSCAKLYHPYGKRGVSKVYYQVRNRWHFMLKTYAWRTLIFILPAIILYEFFLLGFMLVKKQGGTYFRANLSVLKSLPSILEKRSTVQKFRKTKDRETLTVGIFTVREDLAQKKLFSFIKTFNKVINSYWHVVRNLLLI